MLAFVVIVSYPGRTLPPGQSCLCTWFEEFGGKPTAPPHIAEEGPAKGRGAEGYRFGTKEAAEAFRNRTCSFLAERPHRGSGEYFSAELITYSGSGPVEDEEISGIIGGGTFGVEVIPITAKTQSDHLAECRKRGRDAGLHQAYYWSQEVATPAQIQQVCDAPPSELIPMLFEMGVITVEWDLETMDVSTRERSVSFLKTFQWVVQRVSQRK